VPAVSGLPAGHGPGRVTIPLGVEADLDAGAGSVAFHHQSS
jgi:muramoyltetrapeptide carboxypeptidase LdcA involved in peptidoglycan recycling